MAETYVSEKIYHKECIWKQCLEKDVSGKWQNGLSENVLSTMYVYEKWFKKDVSRIELNRMYPITIKN